VDDFDTQSFETELIRAETARAANNEGMARVCARRAAGMVANAYLHRRGLPSPGSSAYDSLRYLVTLPALPDGVQSIAGHFLLRITPDHTLPVQADLIAEARWLARQLLDSDQTE
jgi:hypothetical protein